MFLYNNINKFQWLFFLIIVIIYKVKYKPNIRYMKNNSILGFFSEKQMYLNLLRAQPLDNNLSLIIKEKRNLLKMISKCLNKNIRSVSSIFMAQNYNFGNQLKLINNAIFYCEILGCKRLILDKKSNWFIKNRIIDKKYKMSIEVGEKHDYINKNLIIDYTGFMYFYVKIIKPEFKISLLKSEILKNIPYVELNPSNLYIYIRSGDIFIRPHKLYAQPPLCFYEKIITSFRFKNILIISKDKNNPVIDALLQRYSNIIYNKNSFKKDLSLLLYSYNLVGAFSTLIYTIIRINNNIKLFWEFLINIPSIHYMHYYLDNNFIIYNMKPSKYYLIKMKNFKADKEQLNLMLNEKCKSEFRIINPKECKKKNIISTIYKYINH